MALLVLNFQRVHSTPKAASRKAFCGENFFYFFYLYSPLSTFIDLYSPLLERLQKGSLAGFWGAGVGMAGGD